MSIERKCLIEQTVNLIGSTRQPQKQQTVPMSMVKKINWTKLRDFSDFSNYSQLDIMLTFTPTTFDILAGNLSWFNEIIWIVFWLEKGSFCILIWKKKHTLFFERLIRKYHFSKNQQSSSLKVAWNEITIGIKWDRIF